MADDRDAILRAATGAQVTRSEADRMQAARPDGPVTLRDAHRLMGREFGREGSRPPVTLARRPGRR